MALGKRRVAWSAIPPVSLEDAWAYLRCRHAGVVPGGRLTRAWDHFYKVYSPFVKGLARRYLPPGDADDVAQAVWAAFIGCPPGLHGDEPRIDLCGWFAQVIFTKAMDVLREQTRHPAQRIEGDVAGGGELCSQADGPAEALDRKWHRALVWAALKEVRSQCGERYFRIMEAKLEDQSVGAIAEAEGMTEGAVRAVLSRLRQEIREVLVARCPELLDEG